MEKMSGNTEKQKERAAERMRKGKYSGESNLEGKAFVDATTLSKKIEKTIERINAATDDFEAAKLRNVLDQRLYYTRYVLDNRLVGFSGKDAQLSEQYELLSKLAEGEATVQMGIPEINGNLRRRLNSVLEEKAGHANRKRVEFIAKKMAAGAFLGATFAYIGGEVYSWWHGGGTENIPTAPGAKILPYTPKTTTPHYHSIFNDTGKVTTPEPGFSHGGVPDTSFHAAGSGTQDTIKDTLKGTIAPPKMNTVPSNEMIPPAAPKVSANYEATIGKGSNIWNTAEKIAKANHLSKEEFAKAWSNPNSVFKTPDGHVVSISKMGFVTEGDKVTYVPGMGGKGGHFELIDTDKTARTDAEFFNMVLKRKENPPAWLKNEVFHNNHGASPRDMEKVLENVNAKGLDTQPLHEVLPHTTHTPGFEDVAPRGPELIPQRGGTEQIMHALRENTPRTPSAPHHEVAKTIAETRPGTGGMKGGEYFSKNFESKLVAYANSHGKKLELLRGNALAEGKKLTDHINLYEKMRTNSLAQKEAAGLLHRIKFELKFIKQNYGDIIDAKVLPKDIQ